MVRKKNVWKLAHWRFDVPCSCSDVAKVPSAGDIPQRRSWHLGPASSDVAGENNEPENGTPRVHFPSHQLWNSWRKRHQHMHTHANTQTAPRSIGSLSLYILQRFYSALLSAAAACITVNREANGGAIPDGFTRPRANINLVRVMWVHLKGHTFVHTKCR